jgi:hypothetical protein
LDNFKLELEATGKTHLALSEEIRNKLEKPMNVFLNEQRDVRKEVRINKVYSALVTLVLAPTGGREVGQESTESDCCCS